jgi:hypothetical protein
MYYQQLVVPVTTDLYSALVTAATAANLSVAEYVRQLLAADLKVPA